ncbi:hypothetical protein HG536_0A06360 [Torulaspora globosa]|uniref:Uncharacterized protein n=1 Tax=Torulaspora globosa TaxID=48254 RepID=A0A7G3ZBD5_9SACH|nr:uncharacterized protein HG536_0A06360 [Torulaspora globosa]QLL30821.1 hypothetical protein HG536_0A06360 [Torulaspora globosa]
MNRVEAQKFRDKQISQKYNLIHLLPTLNVPELSGLYLKSFLTATKRYQLQLPSLIGESEAKFCGSCGCVRIPQRNSRLSVIEEVEANVPSRKLQYTCLHCKHAATFPLVELSKESVPDQEPTSEKFTATWPRREKVAGKVEKNSSKIRAKKRKMNSLSSLLSKKNEEREKRSSSSLSLESFMQRK